MTSRYHRRLGGLLLLLVIGLLLTSCGGRQPAQQGTVPTAEIIATPGGQSPAAAPTTQPSAQPGPGDTTFPLKEPYLNFGVVTHLYYTDRDRVLQLTKNAQFDWVRQQVVWQDIENPGDVNDPNDNIYGWEELDRIVEAVNASGVRLLVNVVRAPTQYNATNGLPDDPKMFGNFVEQMAKRYGNKINAYEIWNEPNLAHENGGQIVAADVGHYVEVLKEGYRRIKGVTPAAIILAAASSSSGVTDPALALADEEFYRAMYGYNGGEVRNFFDIQAVHPGGAANPPDTLWPDQPSFIAGCQPAPDHCWNDHPTHYFRHVENVRRWMEESGMADKQIWITEYGWATPNDTPGYEFGNFVSLEQQANYISAAIRRAYEQYPWVTNMFLWNMNFAVLWAEHNPPQPNHEQASFAILNGDWSPRPSYLAVQSVIAELRQKQGR